MFELNINKENEIRVHENGNTHVISTSMTHWGLNDLLSHWGYEVYDLLNGYEVYDLLNGYALKYLFLSMSVEKDQGHLRAFRAVRTRNLIVFDDLRVAVPWKVRSWNPMESIEYALSSEGQSRIDYSFNSADRIPEFSVSQEELAEFHFKKLEPAVPERYVSDFKLHYS